MASVAKPMATVGTSTSERRPSTKAAPADERAGFGEVGEHPQEEPGARHPMKPAHQPERREAERRARPRKSAHHLDREPRDAAQEEDPDEFRLRRGRDESTHGEEHP